MLRCLRPLVAVNLACVVLLSGCGGSSTPGEKVPELAEALNVVEDTVERERYRQARQQLRGLVATTEDARAAGDLADHEADRVLAAAARLLAALPGEHHPGRQSPEPAEDPVPQPHDEGEDSDDEEAKKLEEEREKLEKEQQKEEEEEEKEGGGNGDSSENGPDDGHGN